MVKKQSQCFGCTACASVCPQKAITMITDREGFSYPDVDQERCVGCNLCEKVCPLNKEKKTNEILVAYAVQHRDAEVLDKSTSGGMYTALSDAILAENGVVYGAAFDENLCVTHIRAETKQERNRCRGSKYVQSDLKEVFLLVQADLKAGRKVLFTGTPCQIDGLKSFLRKDYDNLYLCDLICNGVTSPAAWKAQLDKIGRVNHSVVSQYKFRPKAWGWTVHNEMAVLKNGKVRHSDAYTGLYKELYYSRVLHRPSCYECRYTNLNRVSDITIADCRGIEHRENSFNVEEGVSLALVNTQKGKELFTEIQESIIYEELNIEAFIQPPLRTPAQKPESRERFWEEFHRKGYWSAVKAVRGQLYVIKHNTKRILIKLGLYS